MLTIKPDGSIQTDSLDEALRLQQKIMAAKSAQQAPVSQAPTKNQLQRQVIAADKQDITDKWDEFHKKLIPYDGTAIDTAILMDVFGVAAITGVGSKLRHFKSALNIAGIDLDKYLVRSLDGDGTPRWTVRLSGNAIPQ